MKIALYLNNLWGISATARIAEILARHFTRKGHKVLYVINKPPIEIKTELPIKVLKAKGDLPRAYELKKLVEKEKINVVLGFMRPQSTVMGITKILGIPEWCKLIGSIHNSDNYLSYSRWYHLPYRYLEKFLLEKNDKIVAVSKTVKRDLEEAFFINPEKVEVIYNPIDVERVRKLSEEPLTGEEEEIFNHPVIVNVARHEPQKGLHHLINIFERVYRELPETRLVLIGDGSLRRELEKQVSEKGLEKAVYFLGWKENPFKYVKRSKVFALTSLWEGFGLVLTETMALDVPPIAFKTRGGHVEVLENCCPLIEYPDEEAYARELIRLLTDKGYYEQIKTRIREKVEEFLPEKVGNRYLKLFEEVIGK
jgi:glycosyltransferase involved in cell wall biosynthesis